jgi:hypothetical protein
MIFENYFSEIPGKLGIMMDRNNINIPNYENVLNCLSTKKLHQLWQLLDDEYYAFYEAEEAEEYLDWYETSQPTAGPEAWRRVCQHDGSIKDIVKHDIIVNNIIEMVEGV